MLLRNVQSPQPHYLVVLNANAGTDKIIVLSVITSRVEESKRRAKLRGNAPESLIEFSSEDYWVLSKPSLIDCNACVPVPAHLFRQEARTAQRCANIPPALLARILEGVRRSDTSAEIKKLLGL